MGPVVLGAARDTLRWVIGLLFYDLLRWAWRADQPAPREYETACAWCGCHHTTTEAPASPTTPPTGWYRCDPATGLGEHVWWCSMRCLVEHGAHDIRAVAIDAVYEEIDAGD